MVPTVYTDINGHTIQTNQVSLILRFTFSVNFWYSDFLWCYSNACVIVQFSVTEHFRNDDTGRLHSVPGVFFFYDLSPIKVTLLCALVDWFDALTSWPYWHLSFLSSFIYQCLLSLFTLIGNFGFCIHYHDVFVVQLIGHSLRYFACVNLNLIVKIEMVVLQRLLSSQMISV